MSSSETTTEHPKRRKSDLTLFGTSSQDLDNRNYTLKFGVNLSQITFEGLNNYSVAITRRDNATGKQETLSAVLEINHRFANNTISIEGGPPFGFSVDESTMDLECTEIDQNIVDTVNKGISWLKGEIKDSWIKSNRRHVPSELFGDAIAVSLLMSSISTIIGGSMECHNKVIREKQHLFTCKHDYVDAMFDSLRMELDDFTRVAINRGVQHYIAMT